MEKTYDHKAVEGKIYQMWEKGGYFTPSPPAGGSGQAPKKKPFVITIPLPNVTGELHLGHAMLVIEDIMTRYHRMKGDPTLWLPGFDHASIAVEYLVTKELAKKGQEKEKIGREAFLKAAHQFAEKSKKRIREQLKLLGFSLDWTREAFTLDKIRSRAVEEAFKRLYEAGLIYQGERIINWCPHCQTALSDLENEYREEKGKLYYLDYGSITIATTRPETIFADVAVAVNPKDKKYEKLIGISAELPLVNRKIPIIADEAVDPKFGTGALKITPAHDPLDFEIGQRHNLSTKVCLTPDGRMAENTSYPGLTVTQAREQVVKDLEKAGLLKKIEEFTHSVGHCQRCGEVTEPILSKQWFVKVKPLADEAFRAVKEGKVKIIPRRFEKIYFHWMENIHDWCISRQLWWGHKIPLEGEEDVLDTWFSSGLWPFSVFGWPEETNDYQYFYPNTVRETGYDILFFWVAREIMLSLFLTGKPPYEIVYLHGLIRDKDGQKMSKTRGNILDPLNLTAKYGTDALRISLVIGNAAGNDPSISEDKVKGYRNFANKIWNAARFVTGNTQHAIRNQKGKNNMSHVTCHISQSSHPDDQWILEELDKIIKSVTDSMEKYRFGQAAEDLYHFFWHTFCDKYIERVKERESGRVEGVRESAIPVLYHVLENSLRLLHPFMPFITEEIWQKIPNHREPLIINPWPK